MFILFIWGSWELKGVFSSLIYKVSSFQYLTSLDQLTASLKSDYTVSKVSVFQEFLVQWTEKHIHFDNLLASVYVLSFWRNTCRLSLSWYVKEDTWSSSINLPWCQKRDKHGTSLPQVLDAGTLHHVMYPDCTVMLCFFWEVTLLHSWCLMCPLTMYVYQLVFNWFCPAA